MQRHRSRDLSLAPLGWKPAFFSEIESFPRAVLQHHYPCVPLHGDFTTIQEHDYDPIDLLVGGTPCQAFSVAGLRKGFADERGNLTLEFVRLAQRLKPRWLVWENVPGVLSIDRGRAFGSFLGGLAECGYGFAYRVLDAQHFGVPQRRRRVFVVGYLGDWRPPAAVLFERESLLRDLTPRRKAGEGVARGTELGTPGGCWWDGGQVSQTLDAVLSKGQTMPEKNRFPAVLQPVTPSLTGNPYGDHESRDGLLVTHSLRGEGFDASEDGTGRGTPLVPVTAPCLTGNYGKQPDSSDTSKGPMLIPVANQERAVCENPDAGPDGAGFRTDGMAYTLEARPVPQAVAYDLRGREGGAMLEGPHETANIRAASGGSSRSYVAVPMAVRRLTPRECERLQGFPDDYTNIPWKNGKAGTPDLLGPAKWDCPDGPRYKALGNSMAVPCMRWIGDRIDLVRGLMSELARAA